MAFLAAHSTALFCPVLVCPQKANVGFQILAYFSSIYKTRKTQSKSGAKYP